MKNFYKFVAVGVLAAASLPASAWGGARGGSDASLPLKVVSEWQTKMPANVSNLTKSTAKASRAVSLENARVKGFLMYDDDRNQDLFGIYEYTITAPVTRRPLVYVSRQTVGGDAVVKDGKLYSCNVEASSGFINSAFYTIIDVETGAASKSPNISYDFGTAIEHKATSAALNKANGEVYCSSYTYNDAEKTLTPTLKKWDVENNTKTAVGIMDASLAVMAFDTDGNLYGITACSARGANDGGRLVEVDIETGKLTLIADTKIRPWFDQSGAFFGGDGNLYWFANEPIEGNDVNAAKSAIYAINISALQITEVGELPNGDEVVGVWFPEQTTDDMAPGSVKNISVSFTDASFTGTVSFKLPADSYSGEELTGDINWAVKNGDETLASGKGKCSEDINASVTVKNSGKYTFTIVTSNAKGDGPVSEINTYVGYGVPQSPTDVKFVIEDDKNIVSWTHSAGVDGDGYMEGEHPAYKIVRQPGNIVLEENWAENSYTEDALSGSLSSTYYEIIPVNGDVTGTAAKSNALVTGDSLELPYSEDFTEASSFDLYSVIDDNNDDNTWYYSVKSAKIRQATTQNDWLVLPPVKFEAGMSYEFKFNCYALQVSNVNLIDVAMGLTPGEMNIPLLSDVEVKDTKSNAMKEIAVTIKPAETAVYRLGILIKTSGRQGTFTVDDISISAGQSTAIPAAPGLEAVAGEKGTLSTKLAITIPTLTSGGQELVNRPTAFEIERDGVALATIDTNETDSEYTYIDSSIETAGTYTYTVRAVNTDGKGEDATVTLFVGSDIPAVPTGFIAKDNFDGTVTLNWDEPSTVGHNGGYVNVENLRYTVTLPDGTKNAAVAGTSAIVNHENTGVQKEVKYTLAVHYDGEEPLASHTVSSNALIAGEAYSGSFAESFPKVDDIVGASTAVWIKEKVAGKSSEFDLAMRSDTHSGEESGCLHFTGYAKDAAGRWISPVIDLSGLDNPEVTLWVKSPDNKATFELQVSKEYGEWTTIAAPEDVNDWTEVKASLADYRSKHVRLGMFVRSNSNMNFTYVDDIDVHNAAPAGIEENLAPDNSVEEIYTLTGIRVTGKPAPGIYIVLKGGVAKKVIIK
ncbi:MAG: hypothetical protein HDT01_05890 [Bacteroidales bacterium]|nr:hypothetical protein [Bacteroidales bacterium]